MTHLQAGPTCGPVYGFERRLQVNNTHRKQGDIRMPRARNRKTPLTDDEKIFLGHWVISTRLAPLICMRGGCARSLRHVLSDQTRHSAVSFGLSRPASLPRSKQRLAVRLALPGAVVKPSNQR